MEKKTPSVGQYVRGIGTLVDVLDVTPVPPPKQLEYVFEEVTARMEIWIGGWKVKDHGTLWDAFGYESSVKGAINEAQAFAVARGWNKDSQAEIRVVRIAERRRKTKVNSDNYYQKEFENFESKSIGCCWEMPKPEEKVVWSSREIIS